MERPASIPTDSNILTYFAMCINISTKQKQNDEFRRELRAAAQ